MRRDGLEEEEEEKEKEEEEEEERRSTLRKFIEFRLRITRCTT